MKKILLALVMLPMAIGLQGCRDSEVALGAGLVGGVVIGSAISNNDNGRYCHGGYGRRCSNYRDRWGRYSRSCYNTYDNCSRYYNSADQVELAGVKIPQTANMVSTRAADFAEKYSIDMAGAEKIVVAFDSAAKGDLSKFSGIGLDKQELETIYNGQLPSINASVKMSEALNIDNGQMQFILQDIVTKIQAKKAEYEQQHAQAN